MTRDAQEEDDDLIAKEDPEDSEDQVRLSCFDLCMLSLLNNNRCEMEIERTNQILVKKDLQKQYKLVREKVKLAEESIQPLQDQFDKKMQILKVIINRRMTSMQMESFTRSDVENTLSNEESRKLNETEQIENMLTHRKRNLKILTLSLVMIGRLINDSKKVLEDMKLVRDMDNINEVMEFTRGLDIQRFSNEVCHKLTEMSSHIGTLSTAQQQMGDMQDAKEEYIASGSATTQSAIDLLFKQAIRSGGAHIQQQLPQRVHS